MLFDLNRAYKHFDNDVRFASVEDTKSPQELEQRIRPVVGDIKRYIEQDIKWEFNRAVKSKMKKAYPPGYPDASGWLIHVGLTALEAIYNTAADKGFVNQSRQDEQNFEALKKMYMPFIIGIVKPIYKELG